MDVAAGPPKENPPVVAFEAGGAAAPNEGVAPVPKSGLLGCCEFPPGVDPPNENAIVVVDTIIKG